MSEAITYNGAERDKKMENMEEQLRYMEDIIRWSNTVLFKVVGCDKIRNLYQNVNRWISIHWKSLTVKKKKVIY